MNTLRPFGTLTSIALTVVASSIAFVPAIHAASKYWDTGAAAGLQPGNGTWDTGTTALWNDIAAGTNPLTTWANGDDALFQTTAGASVITLSGTIIANTVTQTGTSNPTTLNGGTLRLDSAATALSGASGNLTINSNVLLNNNQTWAGTTRVNGNIFGAFTITSGNNARLILNGTNSFVSINSGNSGGSSVLITLGGGGTTLSGALTLSGAGSKLTSAANNSFGSISIGSSGAYAALGGTNAISGTVTSTNSGVYIVERDGNIGGLGTTFAFGSNGGYLRILGTNFTTFGSRTVTFSGGNGDNPIIDIADAANTFTFNKVISMNANSTFSKGGQGTVILDQANTSTGTYNARGGLLNLDAQAGGSVAATSKLALSGGTFQLTGKNDGTTNQTMGAVTVNAYGGTVKVNGGPVGATLTLGAITATAAGGALNFEKTGTAPIITTTTTVDGTGIYSGRITYAGTDWATTTAGEVAGYTAYSALATAAGSDALNSRITAGGTTTLAGGAHTTNTLKIANASSGALDIGGTSLTVAGGGLLFTGATDYAINNGNLNSTLGAASDLIIHQNGTGTLTINGVITNGAGAQTLTKTGSGTLVLATNNSYTGQTYINGGVLSGADFNGSSSIFGGVDATSQVNINGGTLRYTGVTDSTSRTLALGNNGGTIQVDGGSGVVLTWSGVISNTAGAASLTKSGTGTLLLTTATNTFTGGVFINEGVLQLNNSQSLGSTSVPNVVTFGAGSTGTLRLNGISTLIAGLRTNATVGTPTVENVSGTAATLTINSAFSDTYAGLIQNGTGVGALSIVKENANTLTLTGNSNTYSGGTTVNSGTLLANNVSGSATGSGAVIVNNTARLGGSGIIGGSVTVNAGGTLAPGNSPDQIEVNNNVTLAGTSTFDIELGGTAVGNGVSGYDQLEVTGGSSVFSLSGSNDLKLTLINSFVPSPGNQFTIALVQGIASDNSANPFATVNGLAPVGSLAQGGTFAIGAYSYRISYRAEGTTFDMGASLGNNVMLEVVPEPSTSALLVGGFGILLGFQRRRRS